jgi:hypothetical protein
LNRLLSAPAARSEIRLTESLAAPLVEATRRQYEQKLQEMNSAIARREAAVQLELESLLEAKFPGDIVEPVPKGEFGGDILRRVLNSSGEACGTLLWESKRTKNWSDGWLAKLRQDQRAAKADFALWFLGCCPKASICSITSRVSGFSTRNVPFQSRSCFANQLSRSRRRDCGVTRIEILGASRPLCEF